MGSVAIDGVFVIALTLFVHGCFITSRLKKRRRKGFLEPVNQDFKQLFALLFTEVCTTVRCTLHTAQYYRETSLNDKVCMGSDRIVQTSTRSKILCAQMCDETSTCTGVFYNPATMSCTTCTGYTNVEQQTGTICFTKQTSLEGKQFKIIAQESSRFWHFDGNQAMKTVTALWQPDDDFVKFIFEKQGDGSYKIKSVGKPIYMYDGFNVVGANSQYLNGNDNTDDDHMRYLVSMETQDIYRIQTKATGRYVRLDTDLYVSSRFNIVDDRSLFVFVEV